MITPKTGPSFVETLPVRKFHGIGPATARSIETGLELKGQTEGFLQHHFGKAGSYYYWAARGIDERPVRADRTRKSVGAEIALPADLLAYEAARDAFREIAGKVRNRREAVIEQTQTLIGASSNSTPSTSPLVRVGFGSK